MFSDDDVSSISIITTCFPVSNEAYEKLKTLVNSQSEKVPNLEQLMVPVETAGETRHSCIYSVHIWACVTGETWRTGNTIRRNVGLRLVDKVNHRQDDPRSSEENKCQRSQRSVLPGIHPTTGSASVDELPDGKVGTESDGSHTSGPTWPLVLEPPQRGSTAPQRPQRPQWFPGETGCVSSGSESHQLARLVELLKRSQQASQIRLK